MTKITTLEDWVDSYFECGWAPFPLPAGKKFPPAGEVTGRNRKDNDFLKELWKNPVDNANVGLRIPDGVIGLDIDNYANKSGAKTRESLEIEYGALPPTFYNTRHGARSKSRHLFFQVPKGVEFKQLGGGIDILQPHHRYAVAAPSTFNGDAYKWYDTQDEEMSTPPKVADLPALPDRWVDFLTKGPARGATPKAEVPDYKSAIKWLEGRVLPGEAGEVEIDSAKRHDSMHAAVFSTVNNAVNLGQPGAANTLEVIRKQFVAALTKTGDEIREKEFYASVVDAVSKIKGEIDCGQQPDTNWLELEKELGLFSNPEALAMPEEVISRYFKSHDEPATDPDHETTGGLFKTLENAPIHSAEWVWGDDDMGGIAIGGLTIVTGKGGDGKSTFCRWLGSQITKGTLKGSWEGVPHNVLYFHAEESLDHSVTPSFAVHNAEMARVHVLNADTINPRRDMDKIIAECKSKDIRTVFVDPLTSYMSGSDTNKNTETREALQPWSRLAAEIDGVVIAIVHQKKSAGSDFVSGITGSSAYGEVARSVFATACDVETGERVISQGKNNVGPLMPSYSYTLENGEVEAEDGKVKKMPRFVLGDTTTTTAGEIANRNRKIDTGEAETAKSWLRRYLNANPGAAKEQVIADAKGAYSESSVEKAAKDLSVKKESRDRKAHWTLP
ncbi:bifunctional DNA primase/polymerase [Corynebacterium sp. UBA2622]|uniref:bifunctional DNA primase/polymerase n=1 Tax=Corynebacterium sp. UBA2622 TaxID=1946393 RepID=UPI0025C5B87E|nr:bifunctional DNA primase/polymerase [Corynebacterium sp. UBA2622]